MSRPKVVIDEAQVTKLAALGAGHREIAEFFGVERSTITKRFSPEITKGRAEVKMKLRGWQLKLAEQGHATMQIWLGKNLLGQSDEGEAQVNSTGAPSRVAMIDETETWP